MLASTVRFPHNASDALEPYTVSNTKTHTHTPGLIEWKSQSSFTEFDSGFGAQGQVQLGEYRSVWVWVQYHGPERPDTTSSSSKLTTKDKLDRWFLVYEFRAQHASCIDYQCGNAKVPWLL